ncbi:MAG: hypothetical protein NTV22_13865 [bacterium]|nr:hypothetical protein [bacterium]
MRKVGKFILMLCGCFILLVASAPVLWQIRHAYYEPKKQEAMRFCESLIPMIELARQREGRYPAAIDPKWIEGKRVPQLIRVEDFYLSNSDGYLLRIRNPGEFWNDIWGYHGHAGTGSWVNYDGY